MALDIVAQAIRDAVAPVFLLTGVAGMLSVMTTRLGRIIDRYRVLESLENVPIADMAILYRRSQVTHWAIGACTFCALLVCVLIASIFIAAEYAKFPDGIISALFVAAMVALIAGLVLFLIEIQLATSVLTPVRMNRKSAEKTPEIIPSSA